MNQFTRVEKIIGTDGVKILKGANVIVFGIGGVGGYVVETLIRSGIENITIVDRDIVDVTNINRQIIATHSNIGESKVEVMRMRILDINPNVKVKSIMEFLEKNNLSQFNLQEYDYIIDAIDTVTSKLDLVVEAKSIGVPIISSMGTGNKMDPTKLMCTDIKKTKICPLAKVIRKELRSRGISDLKVIYSEEEPKKTMERTPASMMMVPASAGILIAKVVIEDLLG